jgi:hypothetical protein
MQMAHSFISGIIFCYGMLLFFFAIDRSEASRIAPVLDAMITVSTYFISLLALNEKLGSKELLGISLLIIGGFWISYNISKIKKQVLMPGFVFAISAGFLLALSATYFKFLYGIDNFYNVFIWTRVGLILGALSLLFVPFWRKKIIGSLRQFKKPHEKERGKSGFIFVAAKALGGSGSVLKEKAVSVPAASVTIVNALASVEFVFIFAIGVIMSYWVPRIYKERKDFWGVFQKISASIIIAIGIALVAKYR